MINGVFLTLSNLVRLVTTASMLLVIIIFAGVPFRVFLMQQELIVGVWLATLTIGFFLFVYFLFHKSKGLFYSFIFIILVLGSAFFFPKSLITILLFPVLRLVGKGMITSVLFDKTI
jgi:hypothetical protein